MNSLKTLLATTCVALLTAPIAQAAQIVTLDDGRQVELSDDFTWQYVQANTQPEPLAASASAKPQSKDRTSAGSASMTTPTPVIAAPLVPRQSGTIVEVGSTKPTLQLSHSGVDIVLGSARYENGQLVIPTAITNQSLQSVISIELNVELIDQQGKVVRQDSTTIWQSIKRMAETYLRPQTSVTGQDIKLHADQADRYQIRVSVANLQTR